MKDLYKRVSYLRGLCEGVSINKETAEGKVILAIIDTLEEFASAIGNDPTAVDGMGSMDSGSTYLCPNCNVPINIEAVTLDTEEHIICPKCNEPIMISTSEI